MVTGNQVRKLKKYLGQGKTLEVASARSGMDEKTKNRAQVSGFWQTNE
jgi:hypothetical protein